ncbi:hypothetical protein PGTUg99_032130 [Puccinia graminis f. sp. tritici]|uniref:Uncharacterized protein n=1 Tax=Puccinia graminis f. sp. tritici TaxID=56615 RepID=A0A5B0Q9F7_PUCGR|nr:hypothetical protein PGTUg99_032130 [Puccinia graminis f. sp. tritici]
MGGGTPSRRDPPQEGPSDQLPEGLINVKGFGTPSREDHDDILLDPPNNICCFTISTKEPSTRTQKIRIRGSNGIVTPTSNRPATLLLRICTKTQESVIATNNIRDGRFLPVSPQISKNLISLIGTNHSKTYRYNLQTDFSKPLALI